MLLFGAMASSVWCQTGSKGGCSRGRLVQRPAVGKHEQPGAMTMLDGQTARTLTATCRHQSAVYGCRGGFGNAERKKNCIYYFLSATPSTTTSQQRPLTHSPGRSVAVRPEVDPRRSLASAAGNRVFACKAHVRERKKAKSIETKPMVA